MNIKKSAIVLALSVLPTINVFANDISEQSEESKNNILNSVNGDKTQDINKMQEDINKQKQELWNEYLKVKSEEEAKKNNAIISEEKTVQQYDEQNKSQAINEEKRFTCMLVKDVKGAHLNEKKNFEMMHDEMSKDIIFAIENKGREVYINDGVGSPLIRIKPNIFQRYMLILDQNEIIDTWTFDIEKKKALFSQIKTGEDLGNAVKSMVGNIDVIIESDDCNQLVK